MIKQITQATFDDAVNQNIEDFDMEADDAVREAIEEFSKMGIDLSGIIKTSPSSRVGQSAHPVLDAIQKVFQFVLNPNGEINIVKQFELIQETSLSEEKNIIAM